MREPGQDLYRVLGVSRDATAADITRAYRRQARAVHPDTAPPGAGAPARFRALAEAYQVLGDPARRAGYNRARHPRATPGPPRPGPAAGMPPAWPRVPAGPGPARMPAALWAGPVRIEPVPAAARGAESQAAAAAWAVVVRLHLASRRGGLW
jgi:curved DNA-binding protein CbpA